MNRFSSRVVSLVLAVAFLFSAAAVSFFTLFHGVTVFAADQPLEIIRVTADSKNLFTTSISPAKTIDNLEIVVKGTLGADLTAVTFKFEGSNFVAGQSTGDAAKISLVNGTSDEYLIELGHVTYSGGDSISIVLISGADVFKATHSIKVANNSTSCSITGHSFYDSTGGTSIRGGTTGTLILSVNDDVIGVEALKGLVADKKIGLKINKDSFTPAATADLPGWEIDPNSIYSNGNNGVTYEIQFDNLYYTGKDNRLRLNLTYGTGYPTRLFSAYTVDNCVINETSSRTNNRDDDDDDESSSHPDIAPPTPTLIVSSFDYGGAIVTAASNFTLKLVVTNTSKKLPIDNIVVKVTVPEAFTMNGSSNSFYIEKLLKDSSKELTLNLSVKPNAEPISHPIKIAFGFESVIDEVRKPLTADQEISIPVGQLDRFTLNSVEVPGEIYVGEDSSFEVSFVNKGKTPVYNISAEITGNISQPGQLQFIGNLESGKEDSADFLLGALEGGVVTGEVVITYEDANMHVTELRTPFTSNAIIVDMGKPEPEVNPTDAVPEVLPWYKTVWNAVPIWGWMGGGVAVIIFAAFTVKLVRAHREKKREEQDEDF